MPAAGAQTTRQRSNYFKYNLSSARQAAQGVVNEWLIRPAAQLRGSGIRLKQRSVNDIRNFSFRL
jgi:hypothetical protein